MKHKLRDFQFSDSKDVNHIALSSFYQYKEQYTDWPIFSSKIANMALLAEHAEIILATIDSKVSKFGYSRLKMKILNCK